MAVPPGFGSLFLNAAENGNLSLLQSLSLQFDNGEGPGKVLYSELRTPDEGKNALHLAAISGKVETCRFLINILGFDINATYGATGETPLSGAIIYWNWSTAKFLINSGADITKCNIYGDTVLHCAASSGSEELVKLFVSKGIDVNVSSQRGTPLGFAATNKHVGVVKCLLELKADPNLDMIDMTPLRAAMHAEPKPDIECMELLLKAGADPNRQGYGRTPLFLAVIMKDVDTVRCLLKGGADANIPDYVGYTALEHAALLGRRNLVEALFPVTSRIACFPDWSISGIMQHGDSLEAELQANRADPSDAKVLANKSLCAVKTNSGMQALMDAMACIRLEPGWAKGHYRVGAAWTLLKWDFKKAAEAFSRALALDPGNKEIETAYRAAHAKLN